MRRRGSVLGRGDGELVAGSPRRPWPEGYRDHGVGFQSFAESVFTINSAQRLRWGVTDAVRRTQAEGRDAVTLVVRLGYTGHYMSERGREFVGPDREGRDWIDGVPYHLRLRPIRASKTHGQVTARLRLAE